MSIFQLMILLNCCFVGFSQFNRKIYDTNRGNELFEKFEKLTKKYNINVESVKKDSLKNILESKTITTFIFDEIVRSTVECGYRNVNITNLAEECQIERDIVKNATNYESRWAVAMEDSHGMERSGRRLLNYKWYGEYDQCKKVSAKVNINGTMTNINGSYTVISFAGVRNNRKRDFFKTAFCATPKCKRFMEVSKDFILFDMFCLPRPAVGDYIIEKELPKLKDDKSAIGGIVFFSIFLLLLILGTTIDYFTKFHENHIKASKTSININKQNGASIIRDNIIVKILICFSCYTNIPKIFHAQHTPGSFTAMHGIRAITVTWVLLGHSYIIISEYIGNLSDLNVALENEFAFSVIKNSFLAVDTFFVMSGFLTTYLFIQQLRKRRNRLSLKMIFMFFFHRIWRLTPLLAATVAFYATILPRIRSGPGEVMNADEGPSKMSDIELCRKYWWRNVLYIHNYFSEFDSCMTYTWYLCIDMQLYIVLGIILFTYAIKPILSIVLLIGAFLVHFITNPIIVNKYTKPDGTLDIDTEFQKLYTKPWARVGPYALGAFLGLIMLKVKKPKIPPIVALLGWIIAIGGGLTIVYIKWLDRNSSTTKTWNKAQRIAYMTLNQPMWGLCICWVLWACHHGYGGVINKFLSLRHFIPVSRLGYGIYLLHWIPMSIRAKSARYIHYFSQYNQAFNFLTFMTISMAMSLVFSLAFESSFVRLEKVLFENRTTKRKLSEVEKVDDIKIDKENKIAPQYEVSVINPYPDPNIEYVNKWINHQL